MSNAVIPRQQGDAYQASFFWINACKLYQTHTNVSKVEWEADSSVGFDDVIVHYSPPMLEEGEDVLVEKYQVKFHVNHQRGFSCAALIDPSFIGTKTETILSRLYALYKQNPSLHKNARYHLINTWGIDHTDDFKYIVGNGGALRLEVLFDDKSESTKYGRIRKMWREHLGITSDDELKEVLRPLRIRHNYADLTGITEALNLHLQIAGFKPIEAGRRTSGYVELIQKLHSEGKKTFTKDELLEICKREGFIVERTTSGDDVYNIGIRSFIRGAEELSLEVHELLCLLHQFSGRFILEESSWQEKVFPLVISFSDKVLAAKKPVLLHLDTHLSIAFSFGYCLDFKYGIQVSIIQKTIKGKIIWKPEPSQMNTAPVDVWSFESTAVCLSGNDIVIALSVTHDISSDVSHYVTTALANTGTIIQAKIKPKPSNTSITDANHIIVAVQELISYIRSVRTAAERTGTVHLFMAAPNTFAFFLGQQAKPLGKIVLYEFDFEQFKAGTYEPVITLPVNQLL